ncbi:MAG: MarR family winged helix-turn-helix transcriptional regulator [Variibacter sp.]
MRYSQKRDFAFLLHDVARLTRTVANQRVRALGMTRAQWAVLSRLDRNQGLKQAELAEILDLAPISLTRLVDRLCKSGLVERRADPADRRAKRLFLTPKARPVIDRLSQVGERLMSDALAGTSEATLAASMEHLESVRNNLRDMIGGTGSERAKHSEHADGR